MGGRYSARPAKEKGCLEASQIEGIRYILKHQTNNVKIGKLDNLFTRYEEAARQRKRKGREGGVPGNDIKILSKMNRIRSLLKDK